MRRFLAKFQWLNEFHRFQRIYLKMIFSQNKQSRKCDRLQLQTIVRKNL